MKMIKTLAVVCIFCASSAYAKDPQLAEMTCDQLRDKYAPTEEALARFANLQGSCEGVYTVDGNLYAKTTAVIRRRIGSKVTIYLPASDHTFDVVPNAAGRVEVGGRKLRFHDLSPGDEVSIYLSVDKLATERVDMIALAAEDEAVEEIHEVPIVVVAALPTTG